MSHVCLHNMASPLVLKVASRGATGTHQVPGSAFEAGVPRQRWFLFVVLKGRDQQQEMESLQVRLCVGVSQLRDVLRYSLPGTGHTVMDPNACWAAQPVPWSANYPEETWPVGLQHLLPLSSRCIGWLTVLYSKFEALAQLSPMQAIK